MCTYVQDWKSQTQNRILQFEAKLEAAQADIAYAKGKSTWDMTVYDFD